MIRQEAFCGKERFLKGNLHCHTTLGGCPVSPEEAIKIFKEHGYDFLTLTDHNRYNYTNFAPEYELTILPGMEFDNMWSTVCNNGLRCFHIACVGPTRENGNGFEPNEEVPSVIAKTQEDFQPHLDSIHSKNNLTIYAHPEWSATPARYFEKMKGLFALEIWNSAAAIDADMDTDAIFWDELLGQGIRIFGVAADDVVTHNHCCNGWVMVRAENNIDSIISALKRGAFYSSCGPEIHDFYVEDNKAVIECSDVSKIRLHSDGHSNSVIRATDAPLTRAEFDLNHWRGKYSYIRISIVDKDANKAWTNPIFLD